MPTQERRSQPTREATIPPLLSPLVVSFVLLHVVSFLGAVRLFVSLSRDARARHNHKIGAVLPASTPLCLCLRLDLGL